MTNESLEIETNSVKLNYFRSNAADLNSLNSQDNINYIIPDICPFVVQKESENCSDNIILIQVSQDCCQKNS